MCNMLSFFRQETGTAAAEYALIIALIGSGVAAGALGLGSAISDALSATSSFIVAHLP